MPKTHFSIDKRIDLNGHPLQLYAEVEFGRDDIHVISLFTELLNSRDVYAFTGDLRGIADAMDTAYKRLLLDREYGRPS